MKKPKEIKVLNKRLVQAERLGQFIYQDGTAKGKRRRGMMFYLLYEDDEVKEGPNGILAPVILTNSTDGHALDEQIKLGVVYLDPVDAGISMAALQMEKK